MVTASSLQSTGSMPSNFAGSVYGPQNSRAPGPVTATAWTPKAFSQASARAPAPGPLPLRISTMASCCAQLGVVEYDPPESCGESLKTLNHCAIDPGTMTRRPGMFTSTQCATRYSILVVISIGQMTVLA